jgi:hypothetical protein
VLPDAGPGTVLAHSSSAATGTLAGGMVAALSLT